MQSVTDYLCVREMYERTSLNKVIVNGHGGPHLSSEDGTGPADVRGGL